MILTEAQKALLDGFIDARGTQRISSGHYMISPDDETQVVGAYYTNSLYYCPHDGDNGDSEDILLGGWAGDTFNTLSSLEFPEPEICKLFIEYIKNKIVDLYFQDGLAFGINYAPLTRSNLISRLSGNSPRSRGRSSQAMPILTRENDGI